VAIRFFQEDITFNFKDRNKTKTWINHCIRDEGYELQDLNIVFCSDNYLHTLNTTYLNHDTLTDIITFPYQDNPIHAELYLSIDRIRENAIQLQVSFIQELRRVMIHGVLHLCGYGDKTSALKEKMRARENHYLNVFPD